MKQALKKYKDLIILVIGAILLLGGIAGYLLVNNFGNDGEGDQTNTPTGVYVAPTPLADLSTLAVSTVLPETGSKTQEPTKVVKYQFPSIDTEKYFVHAPTGSGLETPNIPDRIVIPSVGIDVKVVIADFNTTNVDGETFGQWEAPNENAAGWHPDSALLGHTGNTVINGHHNEYGEPFGKLVDVKIGDVVYVYSHGVKYSFIVANRMILLERFISTEARLQNARWLGRSTDMRLTLVTCWPKYSNTHRLILVARPLEEVQLPTVTN